jgi:hypothetical protein
MSADSDYKGGAVVGFLLATFLLAVPAILLVGYMKDAQGFQRGAAHGRCDADCRWIHNEGRWDGSVYGEYDDEQQDCRCLRALEAP